jgi:hypothetical protein
VINMAKYRHAPSADFRLKPAHRFLRAEAAIQRDQSISGHFVLSR